MPPHEHDDDAISPFRPSQVHEPWPYVCASRRSRPRPYVHIRGRIFFRAPWPLYVRVHAMCAPLLQHVRASTTTQFLRSDPAMYTSPGRTYALVGIRDPTCMYVRGRIYLLAPWPLYIRVDATCAPLLRHVCTSTLTSCTYTFATRMTALRTLRPGGSQLSGTSLCAKM